jgi:hypothetical protein
LKKDNRLKIVNIEIPINRISIDLRICSLLFKKLLERKKKIKSIDIERRPVLKRPSKPQTAIHLSKENIEEIIKENSSTRNTLSNLDLRIDILPSHIHFITSKSRMREARIIKKVVFICSVESQDSGITNQGIKNKVI